MRINKIFIVGNSRSGTKLMGRCLNRHSMIHTLREVHFFDEIVSSPYKRIDSTKANRLVKKLFFEQKLNSSVSDIFNVDETGVKAYELYDKFQQQVLRFKSKTIVCDTTPRNLFYVNDLCAVYPSTFFIALNRDIRAVLWSQKNKWRLIKTNKQPKRLEIFRSYFNYHPIITSILWKKSVTKAKKLSEELGEKFYAIRYEDFLLNPKNTLQNVTSECGIGFEKEMLQVRVINSSATDRRGVIGFDESRIDGWKQKLCKTDIWLAQKICKKEMQSLGYSLEIIHPNIIKLFINLILLPIILIVSFFLNMIKAWKVLFFLKEIMFKSHIKKRL